MAKDSSTYVRRAVIARLKTDAAGGEPLPASSIYPPQRPANVEWPFVGYGVDDTAPLRASGLDGATVTFAIHVYAASTAELSGETRAKTIAAWVETLLDDAVLDLAAHGCPFAAKAYLTWRSSQTIQHASDADAFHTIVSIGVTVSS